MSHTDWVFTRRNRQTGETISESAVRIPDDQIHKVSEFIYTMLKQYGVEAEYVPAENEYAEIVEDDTSDTGDRSDSTKSEG